MKNSRHAPSRTKSVSRREFLRIAATTGAAGAILGLTWKASRGNPPRVSETRLLMGTIVNLTLFGEDSTSARRAANAAFDRMTELEGVLSRFRPDSQLSRLNRDGKLSTVHPALLEVVRQAEAVSRLSDGAFDVTVQPLVALYQLCLNRDGRSPTSGEIDQSLALVDFRRLAVEDSDVRLLAPGMQITLDAIAKGYIIDAGAGVLREHGFISVIVEAGGDLFAGGTRADRPWKVGLQAPRGDHTSLLGSIELSDGAAATSGDYVNTFTQDFRLHHILDPRRGVSPGELCSASVLAPTAMAADALSTCLMVLGPRRAIELVDSLPRTEALLIGKNQEVYLSSGFRFEPA